MRSRPKPLHLLCGRAMVLYVLDALRDCAVRRAVVVVGHGAERVTKKLQEHAPDLLLEFVEQHVQRGTGDAVGVGLTAFPDDELDDDDGDVLVLPGDTPLLRPATIAALVAAHRAHRRRVHAAHRPHARPHRLRPHRPGQGRPGACAIVEQADATAEELEIDEINTSIYCFRRSVLGPGAAPPRAPTTPRASTT